MSTLALSVLNSRHRIHDEAWSHYIHTRAALDKQVVNTTTRGAALGSSSGRSLLTSALRLAQHEMDGGAIRKGHLVDHHEATLAVEWQVGWVGALEVGRNVGRIISLRASCAWTAVLQ